MKKRKLLTRKIVDDLIESVQAPDKTFQLHDLENALVTKLGLIPIEAEHLNRLLETEFIPVQGETETRTNSPD
jgi:hypothetical protein